MKYLVSESKNKIVAKCTFFDAVLSKRYGLLKNKSALSFKFLTVFMFLEENRFLSHHDFERINKKVFQSVFHFSHSLKHELNKHYFHYPFFAIMMINIDNSCFILPVINRIKRPAA